MAGGGFGVGQLTVRLGADTKGLTALVSAMLQVERQILQSVNRMNKSLESFSATSVNASNRAANAFVDGENRKQKELDQSIKKQEQLAAKQAKITQQAIAMSTQRMNNMFQPFEKSSIASLSMVAQRLRTFGYLASATLTAPIVLAGKAIVKLASDFEFSMQKIVGLTGTAQSTVNAWSKEILSIGKQFGKKPQELAEGLYFIASSGIQGAQALDVLTLSAKAASAGLGDTQTVANYLTSVLNAYRGTGLTAAYATDVLVAAVREGKAEASGFASAMGSVTPIASLLGVSIDQVAGSMAAMTLTGSTAAQAATYLRGIFNGLMKESEGGAEAMQVASGAIEGMGTSYEELRNILRTGGVIALVQKLNDLSEVYGETLVSKVFPNIRALTGILSLSGKNMQYNSEMIKRVTNSQGSLGKAFAAVADTVKIRYDRALVSANIALIELGKSVATTFLPIIEKWIKRLEQIVERFNSLTDAQKENRLQLIKWVALLGPITMGLSVFIYTITGAANLINGFGKAIQGLLKWMGALKVVTEGTAAKVTLFGKTVNKSMVWSNIGRFAKNPYVLVAAGIVTATIAIVKYRKKALEAATAQTEFAKATVKVNDQIIKLKDLTSIDYSSMSAEELYNNWKLINNQFEIAKKKIVDLYQLAGVSQSEYERAVSKLAGEEYEGPIMSKKQAQDVLVNVGKYKQSIDIATTSALGLKAVLAEINGELEKRMAGEAAKKIEEEASKQEEVTNKLKEQKEALNAIYKELMDGIASINKESLIKGDEFEKAEALYNLYDSIIKKIAETPGLSINLPWVQNLIKDWEALGSIVNKTAKATEKFIDNLNADLASIKMQKFIEPEFDEISATFERYKKAYQDYLDIVSQKVFTGTAFFTPSNPLGNIDYTATIFSLQKLYKLQKDWGDLTEEQADSKLLKLLNAEAAVYGTLATKIEVVNFTLEAQRKAFKKALMEGLDPYSEKAKKMANNIILLEDSLVDLQGQQNINWFTDLFNATNNGSDAIGVLGARIDWLNEKLKKMSEREEGATKSFKQLAVQIEQLERAQEFAESLQDSFSNLFFDLMSGADSAAKAFENFTKSVGDSIKKMVADMIAQKVVGFLFSLIFGGPAGAAVGTGLGNLIPNSPVIGGGAYAAKGGTVPPGYPNDTYPAMLSSGETVLPKGIASSINNVSYQFEDVRFVIEDNQLVGILKKSDKKKSNY